MAKLSPPPTVKVEPGFSQTLSLPAEPTPAPVVEQEMHQQLAIKTNPHTETQQKQPHFINYVADLRNLSPVLSAFHRRYDELHEHLDFIKTSIDSKLLQLLDTECAVSTVDVSGKSDKQTTDDNINQSPKLFLGTELVPTVEELGKSEETKEPDDTQSSLSEIEALCKNMCYRSLRKYIITNLSNLSKLREEIPLALKLASNPAKLVMDCFGRFFLQGIKAYYKDSPMITSRQASVLALEYFLLMGFDSAKIEAEIKQEAESSAVDWRKRLIAEGGLAKACEIDARGLLLLIGCFGIPKVFKNEDIRDLIRAGNVIEISDALRRSSVLLTRIPDIVEWMIENKMEVEAVDITFTFGMESRFLPWKILKTFLLGSKQTWRETKRSSEGSVSTVNKANKRQLADLKLVRKCLEDHKMDLSEIRGLQLSESISKLEKKITELDKKIKEQVKSKRKEADEPKSSNKAKSQDVKRARFADSRPRVDFIERNLVDGSVPQFSTAYSAYSSAAVPTAGIRASDVLTPMSYATVAHGGILVDRLGQYSNSESVQPYGWRGEPSLNARLVSHSYAEPSALGATGLYRAAPPVVEGFAGLPNPSSVGATGLYRAAPPVVEGFAGLPNPSSVGVSYRSSTSDLYQFADTIVERETYSGSRTGPSTTIPSPHIASAHRLAYYY